MINPTGYTALDLVGYTDRGTYSAVTNYVKNDLAHHNGIIWRCLIDDTIGITPVEGVNWTVFINAGSAAAEEIIAPIETSPAEAAHTSGTQLIYNDTLYDVIANISLGDSLTVGTNIQAAPKISSQIQTLTNKDTAIESEISDIVNVLGSKNVLPNTATTQVINGITFTVNDDDGSVTANGTATADATFHINALTLPKGTYVLNGCPSGGGGTTYEMYALPSGKSPHYDRGNGVQFAVTDNTLLYYVRIGIFNGQTVSNLTFKPMIRPASIADNTYVPYVMTNRELTEEVEDRVSFDTPKYEEVLSTITIEQDNSFHQTSNITATHDGYILCLASSGTAPVQFTYQLQMASAVQRGLGMMGLADLGAYWGSEVFAYIPIKKGQPFSLRYKRVTGTTGTITIKNVYL